jgi:hypothetical protein
MKGIINRCLASHSKSNQERKESPRLTCQPGKIDLETSFITAYRTTALKTHTTGWFVPKLNSTVLNYVMWPFGHTSWTRSHNGPPLHKKVVSDITVFYWLWDSNDHKIRQTITFHKPYLFWSHTERLCLRQPFCFALCRFCISEDPQWVVMNFEEEPFCHLPSTAHGCAVPSHRARANWGHVSLTTPKWSTPCSVRTSDHTLRCQIGVIAKAPWEFLKDAAYLCP